MKQKRRIRSPEGLAYFSTNSAMVSKEVPTRSAKQLSSLAAASSANAHHPALIKQAHMRTASVTSSTPGSVISWTAPEFVEHYKTSGWYVSVGLVAIPISAAIWLLSREIFLVIAELVGMVAFGFYAGRKPRLQTYELSSDGLIIGNYRYRLSAFSSFSVIEDKPLLHIEFAPRNRFLATTPIYADPADKEKIIDFLSPLLPLAKPRKDLVDRLMRKIKF